MENVEGTIINEGSALRNRRWTVPFSIAWVLFIGSMFLPGLEELAGWRCALTVLVSISDIVQADGWEYYYYTAFNLGNFAMLLSPLLIAYCPPDSPRGRWVLGLMSLVTLHVLSWSLVENDFGKNPSEIDIGYYVWAASFVVFTAEWLRQIFLHPLKNPKSD